jgi:hypothetical protein
MRKLVELIMKRISFDIRYESIRSKEDLVPT